MTPHLQIGRIYFCTDGQIRLLEKMDDRLLHYAIPLHVSDDAIQWMSLSGTRRTAVETEFTSGLVLTRREALDILREKVKR